MANSNKPIIRNLPYLQNIRITEGHGSLEGYKLAEALDDVGSSVGTVANQLGANPDGVNVIPPNIGSLLAAHHGNGLLDFSIIDNGQIQRAVDYVIELADNSGFANPRVIHYSPSRNGQTVVPNGAWWLKGYSQYRHGGPPSRPVIYGPISVAGSVNATLLAGQGCAVAKPGTTGQGAGLTIVR